jgi:hypothetical protein
MTEHDDALADGVRAALAERAGGATVSPDAWTRIEAARGAGPGEARSARVIPFRRHTPLLAAAAAVIAMLVLATLTRAEDASQNVGTRGGEGREHTAAPGPEPVEPAPEREAPVPDGVVPPGTTPRPADQVARNDVRSLNLGAATFPVSLCPTIRPPGTEFTLRSGRADGGDIGVVLLESVYGDVTGDGRDEAVGSFRCGHDRSDVFEDVVAVLGESGGKPVVLATARSSGADTTGWFVVQPVPATGDVSLANAPMSETVTGVAVVGGRVEVRYLQDSMGGGEAYGDGYTVTARFALDGSALRADGAPSRVALPYKSPREFTLAYHAIRKADLGRLTVPLAGGGVCGEVLADLGPLRDADLAGGKATVTGTDGQARAASVELGPFIYESATAGKGVEDAVAIVRCRRGDRLAAVPVLVRLVEGRPRVVDVVVPPLAGQVAVGVASQDKYHLVVTWGRADGAAPSLPLTRYTSDGDRLIPG